MCDLTYHSVDPCPEGHTVRFTTSDTCVACFFREESAPPLSPTENKARRRDCLQNPDLTDEDREVIDAIREEARELSEAFGVQMHVDHIHPIAKGGEHHPSNLQILSKDQNLSKGAKLDWTPAPPYFRKHTKYLACGLVAVWQHGVFQGVTTNKEMRP